MTKNMLHTNYQKWDIKKGHKLQTVIRLLREVPTIRTMYLDLKLICYTIVMVIYPNFTSACVGLTVI